MTDHRAATYLPHISTSQHLAADDVCPSIQK